jgi:hypothetical protein
MARAARRELSALRRQRGAEGLSERGAPGAGREAGVGAEKSSCTRALKPRQTG